MLAKKYNVKITNICKHTDGVYTLDFELPKRLKYLPGQFLHLAIDTDYDGVGQWPESRCFSLQSCPSDSFLRITYSVIGEFTKLMQQNLEIGCNVWLKLPYGELFTQDHNKTNTVFIAGGTGVTPFLSLFTSQLFAEYINPRIYLGFRSESYNNYNLELSKIEQIQKDDFLLKLSYQDIDGVLNINKIFEENGTKSDYFISGPPQMIKLFKDALLQKGVSANQLKTDDWE